MKVAVVHIVDVIPMRDGNMAASFAVRMIMVDVLVVGCAGHCFSPPYRILTHKMLAHRNFSDRRWSPPGSKCQRLPVPEIYSAQKARCGAYTPVMHPARARHASNNVPVVAGLVVMLMLAVLAMPIKQRCGAPGYSCATAVDTQGNVHYYYEVEPLAVYVAEIATGSNIRFYYTSGEDLVKIR